MAPVQNAGNISWSLPRARIKSHPFRIKMALPFSNFMPDRTAVMAVYMKTLMMRSATGPTHENTYFSR
jgi:hypothetical protein